LLNSVDAVVDADVSIDVVDVDDVLRFELKEKIFFWKDTHRWWLRRSASHLHI
jgi:hypothetical protein